MNRASLLQVVLTALIFFSHLLRLLFLRQNLRFHHLNVLLFNVGIQISVNILTMMVSWNTCRLWSLWNAVHVLEIWIQSAMYCIQADGSSLSSSLCQELWLILALLLILKWIWWWHDVEIATCWRSSICQREAWWTLDIISVTVLRKTRVLLPSMINLRLLVVSSLDLHHSSRIQRPSTASELEWLQFMTFHGGIDDASAAALSCKTLGHIAYFIQVIRRQALSHLKLASEVLDLFKSLKIQILLVWRNIIFYILLQSKAGHHLYVIFLVNLVWSNLAVISSFCAFSHFFLHSVLGAAPWLFGCIPMLIRPIVFIPFVKIVSLAHVRTLEQRRSIYRCLSVLKTFIIGCWLIIRAHYCLHQVCWYEFDFVDLTEIHVLWKRDCAVFLIEYDHIMGERELTIYGHVRTFSDFIHYLVDLSTSIPCDLTNFWTWAHHIYLNTIW